MQRKCERRNEKDREREKERGIFNLRTFGAPRQLFVSNDLLQLIEGCLCAPLVPLGQSVTMDLSAGAPSLAS